MSKTNEFKSIIKSWSPKLITVKLNKIQQNCKTSLVFFFYVSKRQVQTNRLFSFQTMSLCLSCISRSLDCIPRSFTNACTIIEKSLPSHISPVGGSVLLQMLITITYEEIFKWAELEGEKEKSGKRHLLISFKNCSFFVNAICWFIFILFVY